MLNTLLLAFSLTGAPSTFCAERPLAGEAFSEGRASRGRLVGGVRLDDSDAVQVLPTRHRARCLNWGTPRLVHALARAGAQVQTQVPGSPPLMVGDLGRPSGGPILAYSHSHQSGRDADLAYYQLGADGQPSPPRDLEHYRPDLHTRAGSGALDTPRTWHLVRALLEDPEVQVRWMFVSNPIRQALLAEGKRQGASEALLQRAGQALHQPSDAPPHDDHLHLRIACTAEERRAGCVD